MLEMASPVNSVRLQIHKGYGNYLMIDFSVNSTSARKCNVVGMAEQISKKHRHQVIMSSKSYRLATIV